MSRKKRCSRCGASITYIKGQDGKNIMVDDKPFWVKEDVNGRYDVYASSGKRMQVRKAKPHEQGAFLGYRPHTKTCTNPITLREIRAREAAKPIKRAPAAKIEQARRRVEYPQAETIRLF